MPRGAPVYPAPLPTRPQKGGVRGGPRPVGRSLRPPALTTGLDPLQSTAAQSPPVQVPIPTLAMTLAASSQRSQIIRSKFRSVLQLRIHRRYQDPNLALAVAPASPLGPAPFLFNPEVLLPELKPCPWRSLKKESPKTSQHWSESKPKGNLTYHQYIPPEPRQGCRADPQVEGSSLDPPGPPLWEGTTSQQPPPRMKPTPLTPSPPGVPSPSPLPHKLELQTLKLEELTVSELRQQLRLRGLPVSGTKSMLLERMRGTAPLRERPKARREDSAAAAPWPRFRPKALGAARSACSVRAGLRAWTNEEKPKRDGRQAKKRTANKFKLSPTSHSPPPPRAAETLVTASASSPVPVATTAQAPTPAPVPVPSSAPASTGLTLEEELQEAIRRAQLLPNRGIDDILEDQVEPEDPLPAIPLDFPGSFDVLSPSPDSEGLSSVFSSSLPSATNSPSPSPRGPMDSLDWLEALSGGPPLGCGPPAPSIFSADLSDSSGIRLWDLLEDPW
ncbi:MEF2-activating motif and SAP domain-containing transcriptional regulator isoform X3 [Moschus berezovskii]|uniref:MEF2-activating motif and SAP domain-containing transcriptional regulator isoform X3 n=1 Tax=Moschus berezovskii TaxID=68408 RepID=UPI0024450019|nr:MEF2-activating motif and SAP domain-containing transcriptional regulator isoform X3 [Moschus berezovskii]